MTSHYSPEVETILKAWLQMIAEDSSLPDAAALSQKLEILMNEGKLASQKDIQTILDSTGGDDAA